MNEIQGFTFFRGYYESLSELPLKDRKDILIAIIDFVFEDTEPNFTGVNKAIWKLIEPHLITSKIKSNSKQNKIKSKSNQNQNEIKTESKQKQNEIKIISNENQNSNSDLLEIKIKNKIKNKNIDNNTDEILSNIIHYYEQNIGFPPPTVGQKLIVLRNLYDKDMIFKAIDIACNNNKRSYSYVEAILKSWDSKGYKVVADIQEEKKNIGEKTVPGVDDLYEN